MSLSTLPVIDKIPAKVLEFLNFLNSKDLVKWRKEWKKIKLNIYEKYCTLLTKNLNAIHKENEKNKRIKKKKLLLLQENKEELKNLGFVHWFSSRNIKNKKRYLLESIISINKYLSNELPLSSEDNVEKTLQKRFLNEYEKEEYKKYKSAITGYLFLKHTHNYSQVFKTIISSVKLDSNSLNKIIKPLGNHTELNLKSNFQA